MPYTEAKVHHAAKPARVRLLQTKSGRDGGAASKGQKAVDETDAEEDNRTAEDRVPADALVEEGRAGGDAHDRDDVGNEGGADGAGLLDEPIIDDVSGAGAKDAEGKQRQPDNGGGVEGRAVE